MSAVKPSAFKCCNCDDQSLETITLGSGKIERCPACEWLLADREFLAGYAQDREACMSAFGEQRLLRLPTNRQCPRCFDTLWDGRLRSRAANVMECPSCKAVWTDFKALQQLDEALEVGLRGALEKALFPDSDLGSGAPSAYPARSAPSRPRADVADSGVGKWLRGLARTLNEWADHIGGEKPRAAPAPKPAPRPAPKVAMPQPVKPKTPTPPPTAPTPPPTEPAPLPTEPAPPSTEPAPALVETPPVEPAVSSLSPPPTEPALPPKEPTPPPIEPVPPPTVPTPPRIESPPVEPAEDDAGIRAAPVAASSKPAVKPPAPLTKKKPAAEPAKARPPREKKERPPSVWPSRLLSALTWLLPVAGVLCNVFSEDGFDGGFALGWALIGWSIARLMQLTRLYPWKKFTDASLEALERENIRGWKSIPVALKGQVIVPDPSKPKEAMFSDGARRLPLNRRRRLEIVPRLFGVSGWNRFANQEATLRGWYRRRPEPSIEVLQISGGKKSQRSLVREIRWIGALVLLLLVSVLLLTGD